MEIEDIKKIEEKWQKEWEEKKVYEVHEDKSKKKFYVLEMYPYPSGSGLHIGHAFNYVIGDIYARYKTMKGFNVLHPMGFDSFGLPAENAAIKHRTHPKIFTEEAIKKFIKQQKRLGLSYDWSRMIFSHDPEYYKWDQWIFLQMYKKGLVYRKKAPVNWCPKCNTVLANEQVHNGKCWRHKDTDVEIRYLEQWFFKITDYAERLYNDIENLKEWPEHIKAMQRNWIGKSYGTEILFEINGEKWPIFTTRPDTIFGVTFMVISAQHPRLMELVTKEQEEKVKEFLKKIKSTSEKDVLEKEGVFTGSYAINPLTNEKIPVYAGNFVVADYGSGMVMAVPAHDQRDFEFAKKYGIPIKVVISPEEYELNPERMVRAYTGKGILINSGQFNGLPNTDAMEEITKYLEEKGLGRRTIQYRLKDWLISRQRFWGTPIPIVYCEKCGIVPVKEEDLPVVLPEDIRFESEKNPLLESKKFIETKCPKCGGPAKRETDTMDTFVNSSWYFLRYTDPKNNKEIFDKEKAKYWMPIDLYIGGAEHACMHLIYFRFYTKFLHDIGLLEYEEPALRLFNQGMVHGEDGSVMSKSRGNVIDPLEMIEKYGADVLRIYLVSVASPDRDFSWSSKGIESMAKYIVKVYEYYMGFKKDKKETSSKRFKSKLHKTIKEVTNYIENFKYNLAVIKLRELFYIMQEENVSKEDAETYLKLLSPFCPHLTEELWHMFGNKSFIVKEEWPLYDEKLIDEKQDFFDELEERYIKDIRTIKELLKMDKITQITIVLPEEWKYSFVSEVRPLLKEGKEVGAIFKELIEKNPIFKQYGKEIMKILPSLIKNPAKLPLIDLTLEDEKNFVEKIKPKISSMFNAKINIVNEKEVDKKAFPGKLGFILV